MRVSNYPLQRPAAVSHTASQGFLRGDPSLALLAP